MFRIRTLKFGLQVIATITTISEKVESSELWE